jgi:hypothetical protein
MTTIGPVTNAGAGADVFDVALAIIILGTVGIAIGVNLAAAFSFWWNRRR